MMKKLIILGRTSNLSSTRNWIWTPEKEIRRAPPEQYKFVPLTDWTNFVKSRLTKEWQDKSEVARKAAKEQIYPQKKARGYARFEQDVIKELAEKRIYVSLVGRGQLWKLMRTDKKGNVHEGAKEVANRIDHFMRRA